MGISFTKETLSVMLHDLKKKKNELKVPQPNNSFLQCSPVHLHLKADKLVDVIGGNNH